MDITVLSENTTNNDKLISEHGLSVLIENGGTAMLFDTGSSGAFIKNAETLGKDLKKVKAIALSHNHYDHTRGYTDFVGKFGVGHVLYISAHFFKVCMWDGKDIGEYLVPSVGPLSAARLSELYSNHKIIYKDVHPVDEFPGAYLVGNIERTVGFEVPDETNFVYEGGEFRTDLYKDEQALVLDTDNGLVILTGCAHTGICNIIETVKKRFSKKIFAVLGGTHLVAYDGERTHKTIEYLKDSGIEFIGGCHCTGEAGLSAFRENGLSTPGCGFTMEV